MKRNLTLAEDLFNRTFHNWMGNWSIIASFRQVALAGLPLAQKTIRLEHAFLWQGLLADREGKSIITDKETFVKEGWAEKLTKMMTEKAIANARSSIDAACIIFAHSALDANALEYCRVTALAAPEQWEEDILKKQVSLAEIRDASFEKLFQQRLEKRFDQLSRESVIKKIDLLFARCQPPDKWSPMTDYQFDSGRLEKLDKLRIDIVHEEALGSQIPNAEEETWYLLKTSIFLMGLVNYRYDLRLDPWYRYKRARPSGENLA